MARSGRTRAEMLRQNDRALRDAAIAMTAEVGWEHVTFSGVAKRAGLTVGALYGRVESQAELGIDLWESRIHEWLAVLLADLLTAGRAGNPDQVAQVLQRWHEEPEMTAAVVDLLVATLFDEDLDEVVGVDARSMLESACSPDAGFDRQHAAASALLLSFGLGHAIALRGGAFPDTLDELQRKSLAGLHTAPPDDRPTPPGPALRWVREMDDLDPAERSLLAGTVEVLGRVGYKRTTIARISRASKVPRGSVMAHFRSKADLVGIAAEKALIPPGEVWAQYDGVLQEQGPLTARAMFLSDFLKPENKPLWAVNLELARVGRFIPEVGEFRATPNVLEHTHLGVMLVASLVPGLHRHNFMGPFQAGSAT